MMLSVEIDKKAFPTRDGSSESVIIADLRFTLHDREIVALAGPSGCGKTTLLKLIGGLDADFEGRIAWTGGQPPRIGTVFQEPRLLPWRTVRENVDLVVPHGGDPKATETMLEAVGLWAVRDSYPAQLSLGMARRVAIARAFAIGPEIVLLDEPFVSLDPASAERSRGVLLTAWNRQPTAAILVTHDLVEAASLADRILMLAPSPTRIVADIPVPIAIRRAGGHAAMRFAAELRQKGDIDPSSLAALDQG
jgi:ABC-type nitrate/sulfonate/bicarbonate transport system ATPase subunit